MKTKNILNNIYGHSLYKLKHISQSPQRYCVYLYGLCLLKFKIMKGTIKFRLEWLEAMTEMECYDDISDIISLIYKYYAYDSENSLNEFLPVCNNSVKVIWKIIKPSLDKPLDTN